MKRRVIQIGNSTQLVSLPRKWAQRFEVKKGDEVDIQEQGTSLIVSLGDIRGAERVEVDVSNLDRSSVLHAIRGAYKVGYDEIHVSFSKPQTYDFKLNKAFPTINAIRSTVDKLIGAEIISQRPKQVDIRDISQTAPNEFNNVLRRIFILIQDMARDYAKGAQKHDEAILQSVLERHDTVRKFIGFCLRLLDKRGHDNYAQVPVLFHIIASLDQISGMFKHITRDTLHVGKPLSRQSIKLIERTNASLALYYELYYKYRDELLVELSKNRKHARRDLRDIWETLPGNEIAVLTQYVQILDILLDLTEWRMAMNFWNSP